MSNTSFDRLRNEMSAYQASAVLAAAGELDLFTAIIQHENAIELKTLVATLKTDERATTVLCDALAAQGYLTKTTQTSKNTSEVYAVTAEYLPFLDSRTAETFVPMIRHLACVQRAWSKLTWTVLDGNPPAKTPSIHGAEKDYDSFIMAMNSISRSLAPISVAALIQATSQMFEGKNVRFLDVGGASGTYTQAFLDAMPHWHGAVFDLPAGIARARERFVGSVYANRVELFEGDFYTDDFPCPFDLAWVSAIIHQHDRIQSQELYKKTFAALNLGGVIAVRDFVMEETRTKPAMGAFFGVNMLVGTTSGRVYTFQEIAEDLQMAGFTDVELAVPAETMSAIVVARKK